MSEDSIYTRITNQILAQLERAESLGDWSVPWRHAGSHGLPSNAVTKRPYNGLNILMLWGAAQEQGYASAQWATFKQWQAAGAQVTKGSKGTPIVFWGTMDADRKAAADEVTRPSDTNDQRLFAKTSYVFNASQVDGWQATDALPRVGPAERLEIVEAFVAATKALVRHGGNRAFYSPAHDHVQMPAREQFSSAHAYAGTILHELTHWTGSEKRLAREYGKRFGDKAYAAEELVAECGSAFLCGRLGIEPMPRADHAQYLAAWIDIMKVDNHAIFTAASAAQKAADFLYGLQPPWIDAKDAPGVAYMLDGTIIGADRPPAPKRPVAVLDVSTIHHSN